VQAIVAPAFAKDGDRDQEQDNGYHQTNLVSDIPGLARVTDANLKNPWGLSRGPTSPWWVADQGTGVSTLYNGNTGSPVPLVVAIPPSSRPGPQGPTGTVFNGSSDFVVSNGTTSGPALFLFATLGGTIEGWNPNVDLTHAVIAKAFVDAVYTGLAIGTDSMGHNRLYAANFGAGQVDVFDATFTRLSPPGFIDPALPPGYSPFGIQNLGNTIYVAYAKVDPVTHRDQPGVNNGVVDVYTGDGALLHRLITGSRLNSPWGMAMAPANFGHFSNDLLIGNFGDGLIHAFDPVSGRRRGTLRDENEQPIVLPGLWALAFGNDAAAGPSTTLFFNAGINKEADGLFGTLVPSAEQENPENRDH
jgi:uncharacterized protein (TIGR03118 family)